jgi:hypothetical protein
MIRRIRFAPIVTAFLVAASALFCAAPVEASIHMAETPPGVTGNNLPTVRTGMTAEATGIMLKYFDNAADGINRDLAQAIRELTADPANRSAAWRAARQARLLNDINKRITIARGQSATAVLASTRDAYTLGLRQAITQARELGIDPAARAAGLRAGFDGVNFPAIEAIANDTAARQAAALNDYGQSAQTLFRSLGSGAFDGSAFTATAGGSRAGEAAINRAIAENLVKGDPRAINKAVREVFRDPDTEAAISFRKLGNRQITVGGWTGPLRQYANTVALTRTREATQAARHETLLALDIHLVQITGRQSLNFCTRFIGLVCALDEASTQGGRYVLLSSLPGGGPPFHPVCSKSSAAYIEGLVSDGRQRDSERARRAYDNAVREGILTERLAA